LSAGTELGFVPRESAVHTLLIECDRAGNVRWTSRQPRRARGSLGHLSQVVLRALPFTVWRVWESRDTILLAFRPPEAPDPIAADFFRLHAQLLKKCFRLIVQERRLGEQARSRRGTGGGRTAIRQIELERQRLGRELHTGVGQTLAAIRLQADVLSTELPRPSPAAKQALESISILASGALEQVRSVSQRLHPPEWQRLTLGAALRQLWEISGIPIRFQASLRIDPVAHEPLPEVKAMLYRAMQEALSNLVRHSQATQVEAALQMFNDSAMLTIRDNGVGFNVPGLRAAPASVAGGIGLRSIREQAEGLGGKFDMESGPAGTKLVISVPLKE
jgi:two-component system NarL family sensor kinase